MNYYEFHCARCHGFVGEPMKAYGYAGQWCHCAEPLRPTHQPKINVTTTTTLPLTEQNTLTTEQDPEELLFNFWLAYKGETDAEKRDDIIVKFARIIEADRNARAREVAQELVDLFDESGNEVARNCVLFTARTHGIDLSSKN